LQKRRDIVTEYEHIQRMDCSSNVMIICCIGIPFEINKVFDCLTLEDFKLTNFCKAINQSFIILLNLSQKIKRILDFVNFLFVIFVYFFWLAKYFLIFWSKLKLGSFIAFILFYFICIDRGPKFVLKLNIENIRLH
jgi:hypothetical protein